MTSPIRPEWLIRQARELAGHGASAGRPRSADLRRAVSSAYYGVFHSVLLGVAWWLLPDATDDERYALVRRFNHEGIKKAFAWVTTPASSSTSLRPVFDKLSENTDIVQVAETFADLHQARIDADYDHLAAFQRPQVFQLVSQSESAIKALQTLQHDHPIDANRLYASLAMSSGSRR